MIGDRLFVYGTLTRRSGHPMHGVLARGASFLGDGVVHGAVVDLGEYPGLVLDRDGETRGELWMIEADGLLELLDAYEGIGPHAEVAEKYERLRTTVRLDDGRKLDAWIYAWRG